MNKLILLRHGQSQWNLENKFTGWKNVPLTQKGEIEAKKAGELIKKNEIHIDYVFSSVLARANKTAEIAIKEAGISDLLDNDKLIMIRNENLNERDYGDLVGLNKQETADKFGKEQVHKWRRSYDISPPNGESLKNVVDRVSPYFQKNIKPLIDQNKNILIAAHGNSLRAMMIELGIYKPNEISSIEIPTGSPLCINFNLGKLVDFYYLKLFFFKTRKINHI
jgi:phosphoglycerate mutase, BPG-dependent, family 1